MELASVKSSGSSFKSRSAGPDKTRSKALQDQAYPEYNTIANRIGHNNLSPLHCEAITRSIHPVGQRDLVTEPIDRKEVRKWQ